MPPQPIVRVPASSANLGPGFDTLAMALSLHLELGFEPLVEAREAAPIDAGHPCASAFRALGGEGELWVRSPIPSGRGLGFSGAARIAGLVAAIVQREGSFDLEQHNATVMVQAVRLEGHADNVAASLYGGVVATSGEHTIRIPLGFDPAVVCWVPFVETSTVESRGNLPAQLPMGDVVFNLSRVAMLVAALAAGDVDTLQVATDDRIHQDIRFAHVPASRAALDAMRAAGAWCGWLSGSGPTVAALCPASQAEAVAAACSSEGGHAKVLRIDHAGASVEG